MTNKLIPRSTGEHQKNIDNKVYVFNHTDRYNLRTSV